LWKSTFCKLKEWQIKEIEENFVKSEEFAAAGDEKNFAKAGTNFHLILCEFWKQRNLLGNEKL
jgi:DNA-binding GntR family transcriptional regulator